ncbi:HD domain-containing protein [candidate division WWE3 bacterium]|uniref:HD domain-containing protein n=1 Tax=candidate division WWE3 bacterium TaxID=2053526 RepID=A0A955LGP2_UNCKA|nr:HD domain-containing protein [candidate division WWE3 bacterium]
MSAQKTLQIVSRFQNNALSTLRYEENPHVLDKESVAAHLSRMFRLAGYITPQLKEEFANHKESATLIEDLFFNILFHDDDEIVSGKDISTFNKTHNAHDDEEIAAIMEALASLETDQIALEKKYVMAFREKKTLASQIAKVLDNLTGNQVAIEQLIGMIHPDYVLLCIDYIEKQKGISQTTDVLIEEQIQRIKVVRKGLQDDAKHVSEIAYDLKTRGIGKHDIIWNNMQKLLKVDIQTYIPDKSKVYFPVWEYDIDSPIPLEDEP